MTQLVKFPDAVWARLATLAEKRDMRIADLLVETAQYLLKVNTPQAPRRGGSVPKLNCDDPEVVARIRDLIARHYTTAAIARELGVGEMAARGALTRLGLHTNNKLSNTNTKESNA